MEMKLELYILEVSAANSIVKTWEGPPWPYVSILWAKALPHNPVWDSSTQQCCIRTIKMHAFIILYFGGIPLGYNYS